MAPEKRKLPRHSPTRHVRSGLDPAGLATKGQEWLGRMEGISVAPTTIAVLARSRKRLESAHVCARGSPDVQLNFIACSGSAHGGAEVLAGVIAWKWQGSGDEQSNKKTRQRQQFRQSN